MSSVKIKDIYYDGEVDSCEMVKNIEVVPRKIVEMIVEECERNKIANYKYGNYCAGDNLKNIKQYAESLLEEFESDGKLNGRNFEQAWKGERNE